MWGMDTRKILDGLRFVYDELWRKSDEGTARIIRLIEQSQRAIMERLMALQDEINTLRADVARNTQVVNSAKVLIEGLADRLDTAVESDDMEEVAALSAELRKSTDTLAQAVATNTPGGPSVSDPSAPSGTEAQPTTQDGPNKDALVQNAADPAAEVSNVPQESSGGEPKQ